MKFLSTFLFGVLLMALAVGQDLISPRLLIVTDDERMYPLSDRVNGKGPKLVFDASVGTMHVVAAKDGDKQLGPRPYGEYRVDKRFVIDSIAADGHRDLAIVLYLSNVTASSRQLKIELRMKPFGAEELLEEQRQAEREKVDRIFLTCLSEKAVRKYEAFLAAGMKIYVHQSMPID